MEYNRPARAGIHGDPRRVGPRRGIATARAPVGRVPGMPPGLVANGGPANGSPASRRVRRRRARKPRAVLAAPGILEAIDLERGLVLPELLALRADPSVVRHDHALHEALTQSIQRHERAVDTLTAMLLGSLADCAHAADYLRDARAALPVRAMRTFADDALATGDRLRVRLVGVAFLFVGVYALTDPTDCATASPSLNLMPPPLHRDRELVGDVVAQSLPRLTVPHREFLGVCVGKASAFFATPEHKRWTLPDWLLDEGSADVALSSLVRYNQHALRGGCERAGLAGHPLRLAPAVGDAII